MKFGKNIVKIAFFHYNTYIIVYLKKIYPHGGVRRFLFMEEQRKSKRLHVDMALNISDIFKQDNVKIENINAPIRVTNISKLGIGFETEATLPVGYYFNAKINLGNSESNLYTVVRIIRAEGTPYGMYYGCEFIGLAPVLDIIFEDFNPEWDN